MVFNNLNKKQSHITNVINYKEIIDLIISNIYIDIFKTMKQ